MCGVSVCSFTLGFNLEERGVNVCYFTDLNRTEHGGIVCSFTFPELSEQGVNEYSFSRLSVQADLSFHELSFS